MADAKETAAKAKGLVGRAWGAGKWLTKYGLISSAVLVGASFLDGGSSAMAATFNSISGTATAESFGVGSMIPMLKEGLVDGTNALTGALQSLSGLLSDAATSLPEVSPT